MRYPMRIAQVSWEQAVTSVGEQTSTPLVSIVTITKRPENLVRIVRQGLRQRLKGSIEHLVLFDNCLPRPEVLNDLDQSIATWHSSSNKNHPGHRCQLFYSMDAQPDRFLWERIGAMRNRGVDLSGGKYVCMWDDDNCWEGEHLESLLYCIETTGDLLSGAHSWRTLHYTDETPYLIEAGQYPWGVRRTSHSRFMYQVLERAGVLRAGSNEYRDKHGYMTDTYTMGSCVDMGEWLLPRQVFDAAATRFCEEIPYILLHGGVSDDPIFANQLLHSGLLVTCSRRFTLRYYFSKESPTDGTRGNL